MRAGAEVVALSALALAACDFEARFRGYCAETGGCPDAGVVDGGGGGGGGGSGGSGGGVAGGGGGGAAGGTGGGTAGGGGGGGLPLPACAFVSISSTSPSSVPVNQCNTFAGSLGLDGGGQDIDCDLPSVSLGATPSPGLALGGSGCGGGVSQVINGSITSGLQPTRFGVYTWQLVVTDGRGTFSGPLHSTVGWASMTEDAGSASFSVGSCTDVLIHAVDGAGAAVAAADTLAIFSTTTVGSGSVGAAGCDGGQAAFAPGSTTLTLGVRPSASGTLTFSLDGQQPLRTHSVSVDVAP